MDDSSANHVSGAHAVGASVDAACCLVLPAVCYYRVDGVLIQANMLLTCLYCILTPTRYYNQGGSDAAHFVWNLWPDFAGVVDSVLFYFRNQKQVSRVQHAVWCIVAGCSCPSTLLCPCHAGCWSLCQPCVSMGPAYA